MSNLELNFKNLLANNHEQSLSKPLVKNTVIENENFSSLENSDTIVRNNEKNTSDNFFDKNQTLKTLNKISSIQTLMPEDLIINANKSKTGSNNQIKSINKNITNSYNKVSPENLPQFDSETTSIINKFLKEPFPPYTKAYACNLNQSVITGTSLIEDSECSPIYDKTPHELVKDIFNNEKVKNNLELKSKITQLISLLSGNDKMALASINNILDRKPPISLETTCQIIDKISFMINQNYDSRIGNAKDFAISLLHDVSTPFNISQERIGTCTGTSVQIQFAVRNPLEYLKMAESLAQNLDYISVKGFKVKPNFSFENEVAKGNDSNRTISSKLMQNSIMDYGDGDTRNFDSSQKDEGLTVTQTAKAIRDIIGIDVENNYLWDATPSQLINYLIKSNPSVHNPIEISLSYSPQGRDVLHSVNVISIDNNNIKISNPWGREETFPLNELQSRILSVSNTSFGKSDIQNLSDKNLKTNILNESTKDITLNNLKTSEKTEIIQDIFAKWDGYKGKYIISTDLNNNDKKIILNILEDLLQGSETQNKVWIPRLKHFCPDLNILISKIDNNSDQYIKVKNKLLLLV